MSKSLVIVESPSKAKTINKILGDDYVVRASMGHVRDLPERRLGLDPDRGFQPQYVVLKGREKVVRELTAAARDAAKVYLAPDPDREGEAIAWHLQVLLSKTVPADRFQRVTYNEITAPAIRRAFASPRGIDLRKVDAQQARRVLDRLVGYKVSPLLWRRIRGASSAGRVQSVALRLVCEREKAIREFVPEEYWVLGARVAKKVEPRAPFIVRLAQLDGEKARVPDEATATALREDLDDRVLRIRRIVRREISRRAPPPYITSTLQQAASRVLGYTPARAMKIAQSLYEGVDLGEGPVGLITYMRTDSVAIAREAQERCREWVAQAFGPEYVPDRPNVYRSRAGAQEAHEAIRPTDPFRTPEALSGKMPPEEWRLYRLIWERFVASQMAPALIAQRTAEVEAERRPSSRHDFLFRASTSEVVFPGYLRVAGIPQAIAAEKPEEAPEDEEAQPLPPLTEGEALDRLDWLADQKFTQPPPRYSEAALVRALEENGIGRPSTYAQILSTLTQRKYVTKEKKQLVPTPLGISTNEFLVEHLDALFNVQFTAAMEESLDRIEEGGVEWTAMLRDFYAQLKESLKSARGPDGNPEEARELIAALAQVRDWRPPPAAPEGAARSRRQPAGDQAFYESLRKQAESGERPLSDRQVAALRRLVSRYRDHAPEIAAAAERWNIAAPPASPEATAGVADSRAKLDLLKGVRFDPPRQIGKRVFDDSVFAASLRSQVEAGRALTDNQERYLDRLLSKYADQIPNFKQVAASLNVGAREAPPETPIESSAIESLIAAFEKVSAWKPPQKRGRREWDDQEFFRSVARQFRARGSISPRQFQALRKMASRYHIA